MTDFQGLLQATEQLLENKNSDETIQSLVQDTKAAAEDLKEEGRKELKDTKGKVDAKGQEIKQKGRQVGQGALSMIKLMLRSGEFRLFLNDLVDIMQDLFIASKFTALIFEIFQKAIILFQIRIVPRLFEPKLTN